MTAKAPGKNLVSTSDFLDSDRIDAASLKNGCFGRRKYFFARNKPTLTGILRFEGACVFSIRKFSTGWRGASPSYVLKVKRKVKKDKARIFAVSLLFRAFMRSKREVRTTYFEGRSENREVRTTYFFRIVKSELHIKTQKGSQNYIFVKSELYIALWKTHHS
jgi:hypothetical protein